MKFIAKPGKSLPGNPIVVLGTPSHGTVPSLSRPTFCICLLRPLILSAAGNLGQMVVDCLVSSLARSAEETGDVGVEFLGVLQSQWVSNIAGYEELSAGLGRSLCMPVEGGGLGRAAARELIILSM